MQNSFVTFAIGDGQSVHRQASFAALSVLAYAPPSGASAIHIITDAPEHYRWLEDCVTVVPVGAETLARWTEPHGFFWRIKLRAMQHVHAMSPGNLIYMDSDVVACAPLGHFFEALDSGAVFMHQVEYAPHTKGGRGRKLWNETGGRQFGRFEVGRQSRMWNAGLVALPADLVERRLGDAIECVDAMSAAGVSGTLLEQFSLSLSLDRDAGIQPAAPWFIHYWGNKTAWNALIARFLADVLIRRSDIEEACETFRALELSLPPVIKRGRMERFSNSVRKAMFPRDHSVVAQLTAELAD